MPVGFQVSLILGHGVHFLLFVIKLPLAVGLVVLLENKQKVCFRMQLEFTRRVSCADYFLGKLLAEMLD
jgi:hypothetical protein